MMWGYYDGSNWLWMGGMMLLFWGALIAMAIWGLRVFARTRSTGDSAMEILRKRLAAGEISQEDFDTTKRLLQG